ncbi:hypothetical protein [Winogradskyella sp. SM1960]|uniref:hypothetical protein n=1 Tax=Winogradskyella sp. SM1960 TaxID=2865955 RepID=UPI001CD514C7|nr:hypothetical protein [Winogradskyella sp. SM1960]
MKKISLLFLLITCISCKGIIFNTALKKYGAYDEKIELIKLKSDSKEVIFFPMIHVGTKNLYEDIKYKIDSLNQKGYYFYYENVIAHKKEDTILRKVRKLRNIPFSENGYTGSIDSLLKKKFKFKLKKELVNQPSNKELGLDSLNSRNVDTTLKDMVNYYEEKYEVIHLEPCDFETSIFQESTCENKLKDKKKYDDTVVEFRNQIVVNEVAKEAKVKIAIIYGKGHFSGILNGLKETDNTWRILNKD